MRDASQIRSFKILFLAVFLASLCLAPAIAQKRPETTSPKYDLHTETKMKVTVEELKLPPKGSEKEVAHLLGKSGADSVDVYLCPKSFLDDMGVSLEKGDEIGLTGSKVEQDTADLDLECEVVKGSERLEHRTE